MFESVVGRIRQVFPNRRVESKLSCRQLRRRVRQSPGEAGDTKSIFCNAVEKRHMILKSSSILTRTGGVKYDGITRCYQTLLFMKADACLK